MSYTSSMKRAVLVVAGVIVVIVVVIVVLLAHESRQTQIEANANAKIVESLVSVGMHEADVIAALRNGNWQFDDKVKPTVADYYHIYVPLTDSIDTLSTISYTIDADIDPFPYRAYIVITLDRDGIVTSVE